MAVLLGEVFVMTGSFVFIFFILYCGITAKEKKERIYFSRKSKKKSKKENRK